ncbi:SPOR domain-containing protein [Parathalassolituus penaei]|uniref:SPOR domain-containing protein n=1 Tax=Parathalassolituus penaei TaxID=2997323 RepID=A0A9X3EG45_9GAMM|nr:SPOR domain-containing protein [Parathalassolituus penaei]MCY0966600.1 SPOR domain-containing protein [Parathalassolituus penaei]
MDKHLKKRILGAVVTVVVLAIALPVVIDGSRQQLPIGDDMPPMPPMPDWAEVENQQRIRIDLDKLARGEPQGELMPPTDEAVVNAPDAASAAAADEVATAAQPEVPMDGGDELASQAALAQQQIQNDELARQQAQDLALKQAAALKQEQDLAQKKAQELAQKQALALKQEQELAQKKAEELAQKQALAQKAAAEMAKPAVPPAPVAPAAAPTVAKNSGQPGAVDASGLPYAWVIQIGAFSQQANGDAVRDRLRRDGFKAYSTTESDGLTRVYAGPEVSEAEAERVRVRLQLALDRSDLRLKRYVPR